MKWSATFPVCWSLSFDSKSFPTSDALRLIRRARHHLFCNIIPTLLIMISISWASLLISKQIYLAKTKPKTSLDQLYAER